MQRPSAEVALATSMEEATTRRNRIHEALLDAREEQVFLESSARSIPRSAVVEVMSLLHNPPLVSIVLDTLATVLQLLDSSSKFPESRISWEDWRIHVTSSEVLNRMSLAVDASVSDHVVISLSDLVREVFGDCDDEDDEEERREESDLHPSFYPGREVETSPAARRMESPRLSDLVDRAPNLPLSVIASVNKSIASVAEWLQNLYSLYQLRSDIEALEDLLEASVAEVMNFRDSISSNPPRFSDSSSIRDCSSVNEFSHPKTSSHHFNDSIQPPSSSPIRLPFLSPENEHSFRKSPFADRFSLALQYASESDDSPEFDKVFPMLAEIKKSTHLIVEDVEVDPVSQTSSQLQFEQNAMDTSLSLEFSETQPSKSPDEGSRDEEVLELDQDSASNYILSYQGRSLQSPACLGSDADNDTTSTGQDDCINDEMKVDSDSDAGENRTSEFAAASKDVVESLQTTHQPTIESDLIPIDATMCANNGVGFSFDNVLGTLPEVDSRLRFLEDEVECLQSSLLSVSERNKELEEILKSCAYSLRRRDFLRVARLLRPFDTEYDRENSSRLSSWLSSEVEEARSVSDNRAVQTVVVSEGNGEVEEVPFESGDLVDIVQGQGKEESKVVVDFQAMSPTLVGLVRRDISVENKYQVLYENISRSSAENESEPEPLQLSSSNAVQITEIRKTESSIVDPTCSQPASSYPLESPFSPPIQTVAVDLFGSPSHLESHSSRGSTLGSSSITSGGSQDANIELGPPLFRGGTSEWVCFRDSDGVMICLSLGDRVVVSHRRLLGTIRFLGEVGFASGVWVGVALDHPDGKHSGSVDGVSYFDCPPYHGLFSKVFLVGLAQPSLAVSAHAPPSTQRLSSSRHDPSRDTPSQVPRTRGGSYRDVMHHRRRVSALIQQQKLPSSSPSLPL